MYYYIISTAHGLQAVKTKQVIRNKEQGRALAIDGTCNYVKPVGIITYWFNKIKLPKIEL